MSGASKANGTGPAPAERPKQFTHTLAWPIKIRGREYTTLTVRRPLVRDIINADRQKGDAAANAALVAACADMSVADFSYLDAADFHAILGRGIGLGFFPGPGGPEAGSGSTSST